MSAVVKITRKYQITIPKEIREKLKLRIGDKLVIKIEGDHIVLKPLIDKRHDPIEELLNLVKKPVRIDAVRLVEESWNED